MADWFSISAGGLSVMAALASALYARLTFQHARKLSIRDLRLEAQDLNRKLNEEAAKARKIHEVRLRNLKASMSYTGNLHSSSMERLEADWAIDGKALEAAICRLDAPLQSYGHLNEVDLETKLLNLKSISRQYDHEFAMASEWEAENDRMREWVLHSSKLT